MRVELLYTNEEKEKIAKWKNSLPVNPQRQFKYSFVENGKRDGEGYKLYNYYISTNLGESKLIAKNISL